MDINLPLFVASVIGISLTGVMMPGPVTAVTVAKGYRRKSAGGLIALGHLIVEIPLIILISIGLAQYLSTTGVKIAISVAGGLMLIWMGIYMFKATGRIYYEDRDLPYNSIIAGMITTVTNPYFFLWWATVGATLVSRASDIGLLGFWVFAVVHWLCDFSWLYGLSALSFKGRRLLGQSFQTVISASCGLLLVFFGAKFLFDAAGEFLA